MPSEKTLSSLRSMFNELTARRDAIMAQSAPLREERDRIINEARERARPLEAQYKEIEKDLFEINSDLGTLARALGGRAMSDNRS